MIGRHIDWRWGLEIIMKTEYMYPGLSISFLLILRKENVLHNQKFLSLAVE